MFERSKTYDHNHVMTCLRFTSVESFQKWVKKHQIAHFRVNGVWCFDGDELVEFFRSAAKRPDDWRRTKSETRLSMDEEVSQ